MYTGEARAQNGKSTSGVSFMYTLKLMPQNLLGCGLPSLDPIIPPPPPIPQIMTALVGLAPLAPPGEREGLQQAPLLQLPNGVPIT